MLRGVRWPSWNIFNKLGEHAETFDEWLRYGRVQPPFLSRSNVSFLHPSRASKTINGSAQSTSYEGCRVFDFLRASLFFHVGLVTCNTGINLDVRPCHCLASLFPRCRTNFLCLNHLVDPYDAIAQDLHAAPHRKRHSAYNTTTSLTSSEIDVQALGRALFTVIVLLLRRWSMPVDP